MANQGIGKIQRTGAHSEANGVAGDGSASLEHRPQSADDLLRRLESGEITLREYLDLRVEIAVKPFAERLDPTQLAFMRETLRDQLESDQVLRNLVEKATARGRST